MPIEQLRGTKMEEQKDWKKTGKKSISLKAELTGIIIGALALTAAVIVTVSLSILDNNIVLSTEDGLSHTSEGAMYLLEDWQDNVTRYANILASGPDIIASIRNNDSAKADATGEEKSIKFGLDLLAIIDSNGNIVKTIDTTVKRQVVSDETSKLMREITENIVTSNGGNNAYIPG